LKYKKIKDDVLYLARINALEAWKNFARTSQLGQ
jgi:hypothetical protein